MAGQSQIPPETFDAMRSYINGSEGTDVTGGMLGKVRELRGIGIDLCIFKYGKAGYDNEIIV